MPIRKLGGHFCLEFKSSPDFQLTTMKIDCEVSFKSLLFIAESLEQLLGQHGAQAVLRSAGQEASSSLIEMLPLSLPGDEAVHRSGDLLVELGFLGKLDLAETNTLRITGNHVIEELEKLESVPAQSMRFYVVGLFKGFYKTLSNSQEKIIAIEPGQDFEIWRLG